MSNAYNCGLALFALVCLAGCKTATVATPHPDEYEYTAQLLAMPSRAATVVDGEPCYRELKDDLDGRIFYIGSPGAADEIEHFIQTLEQGKSYRLPDAFMEWQEKRSGSKNPE